MESRTWVVNMGVKVSQVKPSNCFRLHHTPIIFKHWNSYREYLWFCDFSQQSQFLAVYRRFKNSVLHSILVQIFHPWWCETCRVIQQQLWMKECDILGGQNILWPLLHIFRGQVPQLGGLDFGIAWINTNLLRNAVEDPHRDTHQYQNPISCC